MKKGKEKGKKLHYIRKGEKGLKHFLGYKLKRWGAEMIRMHNIYPCIKAWLDSDPARQKNLDPVHDQMKTNRH